MEKYKEGSLDNELAKADRKKQAKDAIDDSSQFILLFISKDKPTNIGNSLYVKDNHIQQFIKALKKQIEALVGMI